jgi:signal transduction histidine kinase
MYVEAKDELESLKAYYQSINDIEKLTQIELQLFKLNFELLDIDKAKESLDLIGSQLEEVNDPKLGVNYLINKIQYSELMQELDTALELSNLCVDISSKMDQPEYLANCLVSRGDIYLKYGEYEFSISDYLKSLRILESVPFSKKRLTAYKNLAENYKQLENYEEAYRYKQKYAALQDSILSENRVIAVNNLTYKYESRQKNTEIKLLEKEKALAEESNQQQRRALIVLGIVAALLFLVIYYIIRFYSEKINTARIIEKQNEKINLQKINELKDKIQINSMHSMIEGQEVERERIAKDLHDSLGGLLSTIKLQVDNIRNKEKNKKEYPAFDKATKLLDTAVAEVRTISQNLQPGALNRLGLVAAISDLVNRYDDKFGPEIHFHHFGISGKLDQTVALGIYRIIQEILNNAVKHANANEIILQLNKEGEEIIIHVEDDGIGFDTSKKYKGMGMENIRSRVNYLKGNIEIDSRKNEGTSFLIHISESNLKQ